jgi:hypothetical protein
MYDGQGTQAISWHNQSRRRISCCLQCILNGECNARVFKKDNMKLARLALEGRFYIPRSSRL